MVYLSINYAHIQQLRSITFGYGVDFRFLHVQFLDVLNYWQALAASQVISCEEELLPVALQKSGRVIRVSGESIICGAC